MKSYLIPILLHFAGVVVIIAEIILPSGGLLALISLGLFGYALHMVFTTLSSQAGFTFLAVDVILIPITIIAGVKLLSRSPATLSTQLTSKNGVSSQPKEFASYMDQEGVALSDLRPSGIARINGKRVDVVTRGEYLKKNSPIRVHAVTGNQIIVKEKENESSI